MSSVQAFRDFINQRLTAAAVEIFTVFEHTVAQYEEEIARQHRLFEKIWKPQLKLHRTELPQCHDPREEQVFERETNCPEQLEPELSQIKEEQEEPGLLPFDGEQEEVGSSQEQEQLMPKFEGDPFRIPSFEEQSYPSELEEEEEEPDAEQLLPDDSEVHRVITHNDSEPTITADLKDLITFDSDHANGAPASEKRVEFCQEACGELVRQTHVLRPNLKAATDEKKFCEFCGAGFARQSALLVHMRSHTGEKPHSCQTCGKRFTRRSHLTQHIRTHTGEKPYSCQACGKSFSQQSSVLRHMKTHTGLYSCETCSRSFDSHGDLLCHMSTHTELFIAMEDENSFI